MGGYDDLFLLEILCLMLRFSKLDLVMKSNIYLALTYTIGHIIIALTCAQLITGASLKLATIDALIEPCINGIWFFILFNVYNKYSN